MFITLQRTGKWLNLHRPSEASSTVCTTKWQTHESVAVEAVQLMICFSISLSLNIVHISFDDDIQYLYLHLKFCWSGLIMEIINGMAHYSTFLTTSLSQNFHEMSKCSTMLPSSNVHPQNQFWICKRAEWNYQNFCTGAIHCVALGSYDYSQPRLHVNATNEIQSKLLVNSTANLIPRMFDATGGINFSSE